MRVKAIRVMAGCSIEDYDTVDADTLCVVSPAVQLCAIRAPHKVHVLHKNIVCMRIRRGVMMQCE